MILTPFLLSSPDLTGTHRNSPEFESINEHMAKFNAKTMEFAVLLHFHCFFGIFSSFRPI